MVTRDEQNRIQSQFERIRELQQQFDSKQSKSGLVTTVEQVLRTRESLKGRVIAPADKNTGALISICPVRYHQQLGELFVKDSEHYLNYSAIDCSLRPEDILSKWRGDYRNAHHSQVWSQLSSWRNKCSVPFVYILPKNKDLNKWRPIMSYSAHPMRGLMRLVGRSLNFITHSNSSAISAFHSQSNSAAQTETEGSSGKFEFIR